MNCIASIQENHRLVPPHLSAVVWKEKRNNDSFPSTETYKLTVACNEHFADSSKDDSAVPKQKTVRFDSKVIEHTIEKVPFKARDVWYSSSNLSSFRENAAYQGITVQTKASIVENLIAAYSICPNNKKQEALNTWASKDFRGLEQYANPKYASDRWVLQELLWSSVLEAQALNATPEEICNISQRFSLSSKSIAHFMGKADAHMSGNGSKKSVIKRRSITKWSLGTSRK